MTVRELIEKLKGMPQDAIVTRMNTEEDRWCTTHFEEIFEIEYEEFEDEVQLR